MKTKEVRDNGGLGELTLDFIKEDLKAIKEWWVETSPGLNLPVANLEAEIANLEFSLAFNDVENGVAEALRVGARWMAINSMLSHIKGGRRGDDIWRFIKEVRRENPKEKQEVVISEAKARFKKATGKACRITDESLRKHFSRHTK